ncbi:MAG TPA: hypothetical protein VFY73_29795 [Ideonella sp.]|uniref:hypothetical protein n=1 Tax=Ideonella sp. TaxID=1929293 RepID=UPI002E327C66|nr:hypothetical protein [Ideonella sp.]HEX5688233.1 hypothetical protein [Ideonella sp.]
MKRLFALMLLTLLALASGAASARGIKFAEVMRGYAYWEGEYRNASVQLNVTIQDIDAWSTNLNYPATVTGTLFMDRVPAQPINGTLVILAPAPGDDGRLLTYKFTSATLQFNGIKHVRDSAGAEVFDDMTTLHGMFQSKGQTPPSIPELLYQALWTSELHFEWWDPTTVWNFTMSFQTIDTPWYEVLEVQALFVQTVFGALASTLFPWLC